MLHEKKLGTSQIAKYSSTKVTLWLPPVFSWFQTLTPLQPFISLTGTLSLALMSRVFFPQARTETSRAA